MHSGIWSVTSIPSSAAPAIPIHAPPEERERDLSHQNSLKLWQNIISKDSYITDTFIKKINIWGYCVFEILE